jgi:hypothetical protein
LVAKVIFKAVKITKTVSNINPQYVSSPLRSYLTMYIPELTTTLTNFFVSSLASRELWSWGSDLKPFKSVGYAYVAGVGNKLSKLK